jgi:hypothetical protein
MLAEPEVLAAGPPLTVVAATGIEARAVRRRAPGVRVLETGIGLTRSSAVAAGDPVVSCGLAGALCGGLQEGSVIVPDRVLRPDGGWLICDPALADALATAARRIGIEPVRGPIATVPDIVDGASRDAWARRGCLAADMETGLLRADRVAAIRVIMDTPERPLSPAWRHPALALLRPWLWPQAAWLWRAAPRNADRAASVLAAALPALRGGFDEHR